MLKSALIFGVRKKMSIDPYLFSVKSVLARYIHFHHFVCTLEGG